jgi:hypothetical protein
MERLASITDDLSDAFPDPEEEAIGVLILEVLVDGP